MIANICIVLTIVLWTGLVIFFMLRDKKKAKETGTPAGCMGCAALKNGKCAGHCSLK